MLSIGIRKLNQKGADMALADDLKDYIARRNVL